MNFLGALLLTVAWLLFAPPLLIGAIRKTKAHLQNRTGAPLWQPFLDLRKLWRKEAVVSDTASSLFPLSAALLFSVSLFLAVMVPWVTPKLKLIPCNLFLLFYLLAAFRFFTLLFSLDSASPFGAFAASREAALSFLVEPAAIMSLIALAVRAQSTDLNVIFGQQAPHGCMLWFLAGLGLLLASLVDMSRMPIDDPTTHLELTMVHEAMILEASGRILALLQGANWLKLAVLLGLSNQCFLRAIIQQHVDSLLVQGLISFVSLFALAVGIGIFESLTVKLHWRKVPEFIAYALTFAFAASIASLSNLMI